MSTTYSYTYSKENPPLGGGKGGVTRLLSLDVLRGLTVALMILVNNGAGHEHFHQLTHSAWNGLTVCDLVFPFFLFMVGVSISFSLSKYAVSDVPDATSAAPLPKTPVIRKIINRTLKMFLIGVLLHAWDMWVGDKTDILANLRIWGVLERIALCYCAASFITLYVKPRHFFSISIGLLVAYCALLLWGNGYAQDETNIACIVDRALCGTAHLYHKSPIDPEGLLGTIPAIAHTLIGVVIGNVIRQKTALKVRLKHIAIMATVLVVAGLLLSLTFPLNKRIWSPSYVLVTCGLAAFLLTLLTYVIDMQQEGKRDAASPAERRSISSRETQRLQPRDAACVFQPSVCWYRPAQWFGMNAIVLYVVSEMLAPVMGRFEVGDKVYEALMQCGFTAEWASVSYAICFVLFMTLIAWLMYWRKIFIKL